MKIAHLDTNLSFKKWNYSEPQNFKHVETGVKSFCSKRGSNYLDLFMLGKVGSTISTPGPMDLSVAILRAMTVWLESNSLQVPLRQYKFGNAETNMGGKYIGRLPILTRLQ